MNFHGNHERLLVVLQELKLIIGDFMAVPEGDSAATGTLTLEAMRIISETRCISKSLYARFRRAHKVLIRPQFMDLRCASLFRFGYFYDDWRSGSLNRVPYQIVDLVSNRRYLRLITRPQLLRLRLALISQEGGERPDDNRA